MSESCQINLIRKNCRTPAERKKIYFAFLGYFLLMGILAFVVFSFSTIRLIEARGFQTQSDFMTKNMQLDYGEYGSPEEVYSLLKMKAAELEQLKGVVEERTFCMPVLIQLFGNFSSTIALERFEFDSGNRVLTLNMLGSSQAIQTQKQRWDTNEALNTLVAKIHQVQAETRTYKGESMYFVRIECTIR